MNVSYPAVEDIACVARDCFPHTDQLMENFLHAAHVFCRAHAAKPDGVSIEIGTRRGGSALLFLRLLEILYPARQRPPLLTVDPYGRKRYLGGDSSVTAMYGDEDYLASKALLAPFPNHGHFLMTSHEFFARMRGVLLWQDCGVQDGKVYHAVRTLGVGTTFVFLDGDHSWEAIEGELDLIFPEPASMDMAGPGWGSPVVLVDNVTHKDPRTPELLMRDWEAWIVPNGIQAVVTGRKAALPT